MATIARLGYQSQLSFSSFIAEITSMSISQEAEQLDVTHMQSPGFRREFIAGLIDPGELTVEVNHDPSIPDPMDLGANPLVITFPNGETWSWPSATATGYEVEVPVAEQMTATVTFKLSSAKTQNP